MTRNTDAYSGMTVITDCEHDLYWTSCEHTHGKLRPLIFCLSKSRPNGRLLFNGARVPLHHTRGSSPRAGKLPQDRHFHSTIYLSQLPFCNKRYLDAKSDTAQQYEMPKFKRFRRAVAPLAAIASIHIIDQWLQHSSQHWS